jgi:iron complex outermembrane receptor protein
MQFMRMTSTGLALALGLCAPVTAGANAPAPLAQRHLFNIPAQSMNGALLALSVQSGLLVLFPYDDIASLRAPELKGWFTTRDALAKMIAGKPLRMSVTGSGAVALVRTDAALASRSLTYATMLTAPGHASMAYVPPPRILAAGPADTIIVTGTRALGHTVVNSPAPIDVISKADLQTSGKQSTRDLLAALMPSINVSNAGSGASFVIKTLTLRGLSSDEVLVLVNGKRRHNTATMFINGATVSGQSPPDLDLIASNAIDRVEVLRDGAAAQYGSDAIAGVINIVLKNDASGDASMLGGATGQGDGVQGRVQIDKGFAIGAGMLHASIEGYNQGHTYRSGINTLVNAYTNMGGQPGAVGTNGALNFEMPLGEDATLYSVDTASYRQADGYLTYRVPGANTNYTDLFPGGYSPHLVLTDYDYQVSAGLRGKGPGGVKYDLSTTWSDDRVDYAEKTSLNASLGPTGPTQFSIGKLGTSEWTTNLDLSREVDPGLAAPVLIALGGEFRRDSFTIGAGDPASYVNGGYVSATGPYAGVTRAVGSQGLNGFPASSAGTWARRAWSAYANVEGKIVRGVEFGLAGRHESYSDFGETSTGKASLRLEPVRGFALRGTASTGFRAPTLQQEHYSSASTISVNGILLPVQALPVDTPAAIALGAKPLKPERSTNYSVGAVFTAIPRVTVTVDAYQIRISDRILLSETLQGATVLGVLKSAGILNSAGGFYFSNAASTRTRGVDVVATYRPPETPIGNLRFSLSANVTKTIFTHIDDLPDVLKSAGLVLIGRTRQGDFTQGMPRSKIIASVNWSKAAWSANLRATRYGSVTMTSSYDPVTQAALYATAPDATVAPKTLVDLDIGFQLTSKIRISAGANNLFNIYPDRLPTILQSSGFAQYNPYAPYGFSGGFYYGKMNFTF